MIKNIKKKIDLDEKVPILAQEKYLRIKSDNFGYLVSENYILPYFLDTRLIFTRMVFTYGLIAKKDNLTIDDEKEFLDAMVDLVKKDKLCDFIYKAQSNVIFNVCPKESDCVPWGSYDIDLSLNDEELIKSFHGKHRNVIKKAKKDGVKILQTKDIKIVQGLIADTMTRQRVIHFPSLAYLTKLNDAIPNNLLCLISMKDNELQGTAVFIYDDEKSYYMYGGSSNRPYTGSINLLHYEAMKLFRKKNVKMYDFVGARINFEKGSKYEGLDRFKNRFGTSLTKGFAFRTVVSPLKFKMFNLISKIYLKLKGYNYIDPIDGIGIIKK